MEMNMGHLAFLLSSYLFSSLGQISLACFVECDFCLYSRTSKFEKLAQRP